MLLLMMIMTWMIWIVGNLLLQSLKKIHNKSNLIFAILPLRILWYYLCKILYVHKYYIFQLYRIIFTCQRRSAYSLLPYKLCLVSKLTIRLWTVDTRWGNSDVRNGSANKRITSVHCTSKLAWFRLMPYFHQLLFSPAIDLRNMQYIFYHGFNKSLLHITSCPMN